MEYLQVAGLVLGQMGHWMGTLEQGDDALCFAATWYEYFTFMRQPFDNVALILVLQRAPPPFVKKNWQSGDGRRHSPHSSIDRSMVGS